MMFCDRNLVEYEVMMQEVPGFDREEAAFKPAVACYCCKHFKQSKRACDCYNRMCSFCQVSPRRVNSLKHKYVH